MSPLDPLPYYPKEHWEHLLHDAVDAAEDATPALRAVIQGAGGFLSTLVLWEDEEGTEPAKIDNASVGYGIMLGAIAAVNAPMKEEHGDSDQGEDREADRGRAESAREGSAGSGEGPGPEHERRAEGAPGDEQG